MINHSCTSQVSHCAFLVTPLLPIGNVVGSFNGHQRAVCGWCWLGWSTWACGWVIMWHHSVHGVNAVIVVELTLAWPNMSNGWGLMTMSLVRSTHISRWGGACNMSGLVIPNNMQILLVYKCAMNNSPSTWFLKCLRAREAREREMVVKMEVESMLVVVNHGICQPCVTHSKINWKLMYESESLDFEI